MDKPKILKDNFKSNKNTTKLDGWLVKDSVTINTIGESQKDNISEENIEINHTHDKPNLNVEKETSPEGEPSTLCSQSDDEISDLMDSSHILPDDEKSLINIEKENKTVEFSKNNLKKKIKLKRLKNRVPEFLDKWKKNPNFQGWLERSKNGRDAYCKLCDATIMPYNKNCITRHSHSSVHQNNSLGIKNNQKIDVLLRKVNK